MLQTLAYMVGMIIYHWSSKWFWCRCSEQW